MSHQSRSSFQGGIELDSDLTEEHVMFSDNTDPSKDQEAEI